MSNPKWWIGSNAQANIDLLEISVNTLIEHLKKIREQEQEFEEFGQIENLSRIFIEGANQIRNSNKQDRKYRAEMLRIFELIENQLENLKTKTGIEFMNCENFNCETCRN